MEVSDCSDMPARGMEAIHLEYQIKELTEPVLKEKYFDSAATWEKHKFSPSWGYMQLGYILSFLSISNADELKTKAILDLGCGQNSRIDAFFPGCNKDYEPWLCRILHLLDTKIIGVDIGSLAGEEFEHYERNLLEPDCLSEIPSGSVDLVNTHGFFNSPYTMARLAWDEERIEQHISLLKANLFTQIKRVLKPEGFFLHFGAEEWELHYKYGERLKNIIAETFA
jgi:SAM-dependent methyltransferase